MCNKHLYVVYTYAMNIHSILDFVTLTNKFRGVKRTIFTVGKGDPENDAEHSYQLTMLAWYIISSENIKLDRDLVIKYALVHDLVEVHAGDTYFYRSSKEAKDKEIREKESLKRIQEEFPDFNDIYELIHKYEERLDDESRFVYALDKLLPPMNIYLDGGRDWKKHKVTFKGLVDNKTPKIALSPEIERYYKEFLVILEENRDTFHVEHE